jgi:hypothetical protein
MNSIAKRLRAHCPTCLGERQATIKGEATDEWNDSEDHINYRTDYRILQCDGCQTTFFQKEEVTADADEAYFDIESDDYIVPENRTVTIWPKPIQRARPKWVSNFGIRDNELRELLDEAYTALENELRVLAAIGMRTGFDRVTELLGIDPALGFAEKLNVLMSIGAIGQDEHDALSVLTEAGSAAAHRGWKPDQRELENMISVLENFIYRTFILKGAMTMLKAKIPPKPEKRNWTKKGDTREVAR